MSEFRKTSPDDLYYVTLTAVGWVDVFSRQAYRDILVQNLAYCQEKDGLEIYAYVTLCRSHLASVSFKRPLAATKSTSKRIALCLAYSIHE